MIYLDNAATTRHKPDCVVEAVTRALCSLGNPGRGAHEGSLDADRVVFDTRLALAELFHAEGPERIAFTANATEALNIAIKGILQPGDHVITTAMEHNSVLRPLYEMEDRGVELTILPADRQGRLHLEAFETAIRPNTRAIVCTHSSNLTGNLVDIGQVGQLARRHGLLLVADASQTAGVFPIDVQQMQIDILCFTGHKSLLGPQGTGGLYVRPGVTVRPLLSGGSAFGLDAAGGVMRWLEERGIGFDTGAARVPLVCASCLYDLTVGSSAVRPGPEMGYAACENAGNYRDGCHGAGTGASVGKFRGMGQAMKTGIGSYAVRLGQLEVGAVVALNALGDVFDWRTGREAAGMLTPGRDGFLSTEGEMYRSSKVVKNKFVGNTTIGAVVTNARFDKTAMNKIAAMAQNGMVRAIRPVNTTADGDSLYALSVGDVEADLDLVGTLAAQVVAEAILRAADSAAGGYGLPARRDLPWAQD